MRFRDEHEFRGVVSEAFHRHRTLIVAALPRAEIEHIGATAVPGALTKGDLDLLVRVSKPDFALASERLRSLYQVNQSENWSEGFASFRETPEDEVPVGVQLVVANGLDDRLFISWREYLRNDPDLLERYNSFKRAQTGAEPDAYIEAKAKFFEAILDDWGARI